MADSERLALSLPENRAFRKLHPGLTRWSATGLAHGKCPRCRLFGQVTRKRILRKNMFAEPGLACQAFRWQSADKRDEIITHYIPCTIQLPIVSSSDRCNRVRTN